MAAAKELQDERTYSAMMPPIVDPKCWLSTGSVALDAALGRGIPKHRLTQIYGPSQSRKTTLLMSIIAQAQKDAINRCCYYAGERGGFLEEMAVFFGVNLDELRYREVDLIEGWFNVASVFSRKASQDKKEGILFLDSMSGLSTAAEMYAQGGIGKDFHFNPHSRKISQGWRVFTKVMGATRATTIVIDHEKPTGVPGGAATGFYSNLILQMVGVGPIKVINDPTHPGYAESPEIGYRTDVRVIKNRSAVKQVIPFRFYYQPDPIRPAQDFWTFLKMQDMAKQAGAWWNIKPYVADSFYEKDWYEFYEKHKSKMANILNDFYEKKFSEYCKLRNLDPKTYLKLYQETSEEQAARDKIEAEKIVIPEATVEQSISQAIQEHPEITKPTDESPIT